MKLLMSVSSIIVLASFGQSVVIGEKILHTREPTRESGGSQSKSIANQPRIGTAGASRISAPASSSGGSIAKYPAAGSEKHKEILASKAKPQPIAGSSDKTSKSSLSTLQRSASIDSSPRNGGATQSKKDLQRTSSNPRSDIDRAKASVRDGFTKNQRLIAAEQHAADARRAYHRTAAPSTEFFKGVLNNSARPRNQNQVGASKEGRAALWANVNRSAAYSNAAQAALKAQNLERYSRNSKKAAAAGLHSSTQRTLLSQDMLLSKAAIHHDQGSRKLAQGDESGKAQILQAHRVTANADDQNRQANRQWKEVKKLRAVGGKDSESESD